MIEAFMTAGAISGFFALLIAIVTGIFGYKSKKIDKGVSTETNIGKSEKDFRLDLMAQLKNVNDEIKAYRVERGQLTAKVDELTLSNGELKLEVMSLTSALKVFTDLPSSTMTCKTESVVTTIDVNKEKG